MIFLHRFSRYIIKHRFIKGGYEDYADSYKDPNEYFPPSERTRSISYNYICIFNINYFIKGSVFNFWSCIHIPGINLNVTNNINLDNNYRNTITTEQASDIFYVVTYSKTNTKCKYKIFLYMRDNKPIAYHIKRNCAY